jgi:transcriptional regulator with XRE-family HTH domain
MDNTSALLAERLRKERADKRWSLAEVAERSGISKAMLSKIERAEVSPTAAVLARVAAAFGLTLAQFLTPAQGPSKRLLSAREQPRWKDPGTGYTRKQIFIDAQTGLEVVEVGLPPGVSASFPADVYQRLGQVAWVISGKLTIVEGQQTHELRAGVRLEFGAPAEVTYRNAGSRPCRYLIALLRT